MVNKNNQKQEEFPKSDVAKIEEKIIDFWEKSKTFKKSVEKKAPQGDYVFYDGPPFGTGEPHYGHILSSVAKDVVPRYWTMKGYRVERRWGWDCHGLPIENIIEKDMGISGKKEIEEMGIDKFNEACRARVLEYADVWDVMVKRIARWVEFKNSYKTMNPEFMESVWWGFKELWEKDLIYQGRKVLLYCPRCETPISNFEVAMDNSYKEITEPSVYVKFRIKNEELRIKNLGIKDGEGVYILAWTTTPWTLPGNVALAVGKDIDYVIIREKEMTASVSSNHEYELPNNNELYILAKDVFAKEDQKLVPGDNLSKAYYYHNKVYEVIDEIKGKELVGLKYEPLFDVPALKDSGKNVYVVADADFVTTEDGTGVVHTAVVYGEDDYNLGLKLDLPIVPALDEKGHFNNTVPQFKGMYFKKADKEIIKDLNKRGLLFRAVDYAHSYPHCHRCETQLFYNAIPAWFLSIEKIRKNLLKQNKNINWYPEHLKEGRFKIGIEQAPDWNISRNRYFATPMPIWECDKCKKREVIGSIKGLEKKVGMDTFYIMRHGEAEFNVKRIYSTNVDSKNDLTEKGIEDAGETAKKLKDKKIDIIICSDFLRTKETANIVAKEIGVEVIEDERIREINVGDLDNKPYDMKIIEQRDQNEFLKYPNGESWSDVKKRVSDFYKEVSQKYKNKKVLIVSHGDTLTAFEALLTDGYFLDNIKKIVKDRYIKKAETRKLKQRIFDIHSHFIDGLSWQCSKCSDGKMHRIKEVFDCWVESGSMSFAQHHYPFENKKKFESTFPAQYISEYIPQTRAWFYVMHVMSTALFNKNSFENVVTTGVILNEEGKKMSKSKKNYPDPWKVINQFGVDSLRYYLMSSTLMHAGNLFFSERELRDVFRKNIMMTMNVYRFYAMFAPVANDNESETNITNIKEKDIKSEHILDQWILSRLNQLIIEASDKMDNYDLPRATRPIIEFIDDLSTWYLRRSRDRFKGDDEDDKKAAIATTGFVLIQLSKVMAPFMPFIAEKLWQEVGGKKFQDENASVHLENWPKAGKVDEKILEEMAATRKIVELGLAARDEAKIKVRQPLSTLRVVAPKKVAIRNPYIELIKDEVNVKEVEFKGNADEVSVELDTNLTPELRQEGMKRELVRTINAMRKKAGLTIKDRIEIVWQGGEKIGEVIKKYEAELLSDTLAISIISNDQASEGV
ncbi:class I tRNA ligase family protein, partial [Candidatus Parcubacteria bacterium]|nr:class I tRNA ligase family protein [Candidatus Parcubacteria bacterium]